MDLENLCRFVHERLFDIPCHPRGLLGDLEVCIGVISESASAAEISLSREMIGKIGEWLGNEERTETLLSSVSVPDGFFGEQLAEQLIRDGKSDSQAFS